MTTPMRSENFSLFPQSFSDFCKEVVIEKFDENGIELIEDNVIKEERVEFFLNNEKFLSVMTIAQDQDAHIVGFLLSEAVIKSYDDVKDISISEDGLKVNINATISQDGYANLFKEKTLTSGCCVGVTGNADKSFECAFVNTKYSVSANDVLANMRKFNTPSELFENTGCVHKAELILEDGTIFTSEDIGRHNAIDKVVGLASMNHKDIKKSVLYASGRLSMEMVVKCVMHKIPIVVSKAAVTFQGLKAANEHGITLIGFARNKKMNIYTHSGRINV
ncbi:formate dehydrogenase family accessory protein FdhD [Arcobacter nitrofigilis DSM 7299]|uniref:Sulfur carrier protein FdhD n=1 Tax=Arcobacter nitrofigilis (strain ATCC 33309 / DSM 7299 / CCUG 15893 / LMG 7604 / NCTC 12251 / CI) TaxID=572480 RepID=D5V344_ARCNC|nr:formate dehydrogenase accessory sulfurtransferase FdhD [Arcobacter nitrofigilis]ADG92626.1 formate dehydrogenase family accessory protein FdhD [Arcobacter nitrofigilis DSM 7299]